MFPALGVAQGQLIHGDLEHISAKVYLVARMQISFQLCGVWGGEAGNSATQCNMLILRWVI